MLTLEEKLSRIALWRIREVFSVSAPEHVHNLLTLMRHIMAERDRHLGGLCPCTEGRMEDCLGWDEKYAYYVRAVIQGAEWADRAQELINSHVIAFYEVRPKNEHDAEEPVGYVAIDTRKTITVPGTNLVLWKGVDITRDVLRHPFSRIAPVVEVHPKFFEDPFVRPVSNHDELPIYVLWAALRQLLPIENEKQEVCHACHHFTPYARKSCP